MRVRRTVCLLYHPRSLVIACLRMKTCKPQYCTEHPLNVVCYDGIIRAPRSHCELERECLDELHAAAFGKKWPLEWRWDLDCEPGNRRGVVLDEESRVVALQLNFGCFEGETWWATVLESMLG